MERIQNKLRGLAASSPPTSQYASHTVASSSVAAFTVGGGNGNGNGNGNGDGKLNEQDSFKNVACAMPAVAAFNSDDGDGTSDGNEDEGEGDGSSGTPSEHAGDKHIQSGSTDQTPRNTVGTRAAESFASVLETFRRTSMLPSNTKDFNASLRHPHAMTSRHWEQLIEENYTWSDFMQMLRNRRCVQMGSIVVVLRGSIEYLSDTRLNFIMNSGSFEAFTKVPFSSLSDDDFATLEWLLKLASFGTTRTFHLSKSIASLHTFMWFSKVIREKSVKLSYIVNEAEIATDAATEAAQSTSKNACTEKLTISCSSHRGCARGEDPSQTGQQEASVSHATCVQFDHIKFETGVANFLAAMSIIQWTEELEEISISTRIRHQPALWNDLIWAISSSSHVRSVSLSGSYPRKYWFHKVLVLLAATSLRRLAYYLDDQPVGEYMALSAEQLALIAESIQHGQLSYMRCAQYIMHPRHHLNQWLALKGNARRQVVDRIVQMDRHDLLGLWVEHEFRAYNNCDILFYALSKHCVCFKHAWDAGRDLRLSQLKRKHSSITKQQEELATSLMKVSKDMEELEALMNH